MLCCPAHRICRSYCILVFYLSKLVGWLVWLDGEDRALTVHTDMLCVARADNCGWLVGVARW